MSFGDVRAALALRDPAFALAALRAEVDAVDRGRAAWDRHTAVDPATGARREIAADTADDAALAARIADASDPDDADLAALLAIVDASRAVTGDASTLRSAGPRRRAWCGSPVQSLRFA